MNVASMKPYAWLSIVVALTTIVVKTVAWWMAGSVGLLSDALESLVNLAGALMALPRTTVLTHLQPVDDRSSLEDIALDRR